MATKLTDSLYFSRLAGHEVTKLLDDMKVTHVIAPDIDVPVDCHQHVKALTLSTKFMPDYGALLHELDRCVAFIKNAIESGGRVIVLCATGCGCAPSLCIAYLMKQNKHNVQHTINSMPLNVNLPPHPNYLQLLHTYHSSDFKAADAVTLLSKDCQNTLNRIVVAVNQLTGVVTGKPNEDDTHLEQLFEVQIELNSMLYCEMDTGTISTKEALFNQIDKFFAVPHEQYLLWLQLQTIMNKECDPIPELDAMQVESIAEEEVKPLAYANEDGDDGEVDVEEGDQQRKVDHLHSQAEAMPLNTDPVRLLSEEGDSAFFTAFENV